MQVMPAGAAWRGAMPAVAQAPPRTPGEQWEGDGVAEEIPGLGQAPTRHGGLIAWVAQIAALTRPAAPPWGGGAPQEGRGGDRPLVPAGGGAPPPPPAPPARCRPPAPPYPLPPPP